MGVQVRDGCVLNAAGLASMVKDNQLSFLKAYGGGEGLAKELGSDSIKGMRKDADFSEVKEMYGKNSIDPPTVTPYLMLIWDGLHDTTLLMLIASAVVSLVLGLAVPHESTDNTASDSSSEWIEGVAILGTVCIVLNVQAMTDWSKARQFRKQLLELEADKVVHVLRSGDEVVLHPRELVVGDVLRIAVGDILAADAVMLQGSDVKMDESALTGETTLIDKCAASVALGQSDPASDVKPGKATPFLLSGTSVMNGSGRVLVVAVGSNSLQGRILALASKQSDTVVAAMDNPNEAEPEIEMKPSGNVFMRCCVGIKSLFTFGDMESGGSLTEKLDSLAVDIGKAGLIVATVAFIAMLVNWGVGRFGPDDSEPWNGADDVSAVLEKFITAVVILVVAVPEGLPLAVTLSVAVSMRRMTKDNNMVKHMDSCATMGNATTICSDKTGTLTENRMTVMRALIGGDQVFDHDKESNRSVGEIIKASIVPTEMVQKIVQSIALNSAKTTTVTKEADGSFTYTGNATECALLKLSLQLGYPVDSIRSDPAFSDPNGKLDWGVFNVPFSSSRKKMSWVVPIGSGQFRLFSKGAPSYIFESCSHFATLDGQSKPFDPTLREQSEGYVVKFQGDAMRTIALAYRDFDQEPSQGWETAESECQLETDMTLLCVVGIEDPLRPSVIQAIKNCNSAGIDVRMCTGDALETAVAISKQCGILRPRDLQDGKPKENFAMTGSEFDERVHFIDTSKPKVQRRVFDAVRNDASVGLGYPFVVDDNGDRILNQREFDAIWPKLRVLARCQPEDKLTLVRGLRNSKLFQDYKTCNELRKEHGIEVFPDFQVVAVTGDGTNDAPALRSADVGFAMGIVGTDIAKQACDILLMDDNFASIVKAAMWGRNVYDSISKFIQFQLTINLVAITIAVVGAFTFSSSPLGAVQMLWVNMIMDSLASIALATEPPTEALLERPPYGKRRSVISRTMYFNIVGHSFYQLIVMLVLLFGSTAWLPGDVPAYPPSATDIQSFNETRLLTATTTAGDLTLWTIVFNAFVQMQLFNQLNSRKLTTIDRLQSNWSEWNVLDGILRNKIFLVVITLEFVLQVLIIQFTGKTFRIVEGGLSAAQWAVCIGFGFGSIIWQFVVNAVLLATTDEAGRSKGVCGAKSRPNEVYPEMEQVETK